MCGEITSVCTDCGAKRFVFWDECKSYWRLYAEALESGKGGAGGIAKPHPADCDRHRRLERTANLGTCPNLDNCVSKGKLRLKQHEAMRRAMAAAAARLERDRRERRCKAAFAKRYFQKRPVGAVLPPASEPIEFFLDEEERRQGKQEKQHRRRQQEVEEVATEVLRRKTSLQSRARGLAIPGGGGKRHGQGSPFNAQDASFNTRRSPRITQGPPLGTKTEEAFEEPDSGIALDAAKSGASVDVADSGVSLSMPDPEEGVYQRQAMSSNASLETIVVTGLNVKPRGAAWDAKVVTETHAKPSCLPAGNDAAASRQVQLEEAAAAAKGAGWGLALGTVGYVWSKISTGLGILR